MHNLRIATLGLVASAAIPAMAWPPVHERSESAVDHGTLQNTKSFYYELSFDGNTWEEIVKNEAPASTDLGPVARQGICSAMTGFAQILCANIPTREAWWAAGGAMAIWYATDVLVKWTDAIAHVIVTARSLQEMKSAQNLGVRSLASVLAKMDLGSLDARSASDDEDAEMALLNDYIYEDSTGIIHYQGTKPH
ncbi:uncharacterized protein JN550_005337 [Neoarthrinium moseri]|uniref:uncharacterized protein n=1 Tax=Neoarthrinium moseri TaxID=1658444 RepID=UPI001FDD042D|nr:uncharacterized protein JN550_005337 [Neoarthrinium moseri]KAI1870409.1 hypothetical protein JN550_005337 [Neoarthrinium moseri]